MPDAAARWLAAHGLQTYALAYLAFCLFPYDVLISWVEIEQKLASDLFGWWLAGGLRRPLVVTVQLGVEVATKYGENPLVVNCIAAHHDDVPHESEVSVLVQAGDSISGSRPGARREAFETYVKRLEGLEKIASSYKGVERVFAIQAGREIRVVVIPDDVDDGRMTTLSEEIARRIEAELQYPGQIKVVLIRETRAVDFAR